MRRANAGMRIVINEKDSENSLQQRKLQSSERRKPLLLKQLEHISGKLDNINQQNFTENQDPYLNDPVLQQLQNLVKDAAKHELRQIQKLCKLAIGRRILNIELKKKKIEHDQKMENREKIQMFFRENRIKKFDYDGLIEQKLRDSTLIAKAYPNGKGFIQSVSHYTDQYDEALRESDFLKVIKTVNGLFYRNYSSLSKGALTLTDILLSLIWIPIAIFVSLAVTLPFMSFKNEQVVLMVLLGLILLVLFYVSVRTYMDKPNNKNYIEQSVEDVMAYFQKLNQENEQKGRRVEWSCSGDFMYLEVIFHDGFPQ